VGNVWDGTVTLIDAGTLHVIKTLSVETAHGRGEMVLDFNPKASWAATFVTSVMRGGWAGRCG
jgi:hypothetical protein